MPSVKIYLTDTGTGEQRVAGEIRLEGGKAVPYGPQLVHRIASRPLEVTEPNGPFVTIDPEKEPARFLENLARTGPRTPSILRLRRRRTSRPSDDGASDLLGGETSGGYQQAGRHPRPAPRLRQPGGLHQAGGASEQPSHSRSGSSSSRVG